MDTVAHLKDSHSRTAGDTSSAARAGSSRISGRWLGAALGIVVAGLFIASLSGGASEDPRTVHLEQTEIISPDPSLLPGDSISGIRPGASREEAERLFRDAYWGSPYEKQGISTLGDISSQPYVVQLWDVHKDSGATSIVHVDLSTPAAGNAVVSVMQRSAYSGSSGYPDVADVEANLIDKFGSPSGRYNWLTSDATVLVWVRGDGSCKLCQYDGYQDPWRKNAEELSELGLPSSPVIAATIDRRPANRDKVEILTIRVTDYSMIARSVEAEGEIMRKAQAAFDDLPGPRTDF
jgi:hypothetical protein